MIPTTTTTNSNEGATLVSPVAQQQPPPAFGARKTSGSNGTSGGLGNRKNSSITEINGGKHPIDYIGSIGGTSRSSSSKRRLATLIDVLERCRDRRHRDNITTTNSSISSGSMTMMTTTPRTAFGTTTEGGSNNGSCPAYISATSSSSSSWSSYSSAHSSPAYDPSPSSYLHSSNYSVMECVPTFSFASTSTAGGASAGMLPEALPTSFVSPVFAPRRLHQSKLHEGGSSRSSSSTSGSSRNDHLLLDRYLPPAPANGHDGVEEENAVGLASVAGGRRGIGGGSGIGGAGGIIGLRPATATTTGMAKDVLTLATDEDDANLAAKHAFGRRWLYECIREPIESTASAASATGTSAIKAITNTDVVGPADSSSSSFNNDIGMSIFVGDNKENVDPASARKKKKRRTNPKATTTNSITNITTPSSSNNNTNTVSLTSATHRLCLRCRHCRDGADVLRPKSLSEYHFYSKIVRWSSAHYESCPALPPVLQMRYEEAKANASRGRKQFWAESAAKIGLVDIVDEAGQVGHGVAFAPLEEDANDGAAGGDELTVEDYGMPGK